MRRLALLALLTLSWACGTVTIDETGGESGDVLTDGLADASTLTDAAWSDGTDGADDAVVDAGAVTVTQDATASPDILEADTDPGPPPVLEPCTLHTECDSGVCLGFPTGSGCAPDCGQGCGGGWVCKPLSGAGDDPVPVCVPPEEILCMPCTGDPDCAGEVGASANRCLSHGAVGSYCAIDCSVLPCPTGYACSDEFIDNTNTKVCRPADNGDCNCGALATYLGASTACLLAKGCGGERRCQGSGLSACKEVPGAPDTCDGIDNDCDGATDETACDDGNPCTADLCDPGADPSCQHGEAAGACDDGDPCTKGDVCAAGSCTSGPANTCDDGQSCTIDSCDTWAGGCQYEAINAEPCDDGVPCTEPTNCKDGTCTKGKFKLCDDSNPCTKDSCDPADDTCDHTAHPDGAFCNDDNACSLSQSCKGGWCQGQAKSCDDNNPCSKDSCISKTGKCQHKNLPMNGKGCDDSNACTIQDACAKGSCAGKPKGCDDGNPCTNDGCDKVGGCVHPANSAKCDDGNPCTAGDVCQKGTCVGGSSTCECQLDGDCAKLDDDDLCNGKLICTSNVCVVDAATVISCGGQGAKCKVSACQPKTGVCKTVAKADGTPCEADGKPCTVESCGAGQCGSPQAKDCNDDNLCTADTCVAASGKCAHDPKPLAGKGCDDGNACTNSGTCKGGGCATGPAKICKDELVCAVVECDPKTGECKANGVPMAGKPCDADSNVCTTGDNCKAGKCIAGKTLPCDDGNPCTIDGCHKTKGCQHGASPNGEACGGGKICVAGVCKAACLTWDVMAAGPGGGHSYLFGASPMGGGVVAVGRTRQGSYYQGWVVVVDAEGKVKTNVALVPDSYTSWLVAASPGPANSIYAAGELRPSKSNNVPSGWVTRLDAAGKAAWHLPVTQGKQARFYGISTGADGSALAVGQVYVSTLHYYDGWLVKVSAAGKVLAKSSYNMGKFKVTDALYGVSHANGNEAYVAGLTRPGSAGNDGWLVRLNSGGKMVWSKTYGGPSHDTFRRARTHPAGVAAAGYTYVSGKSYQGWLMLVDSAGKTKWEKVLGANSSDRLEDLLVLEDGSVVAVGQTYVSGKSSQGWLMHYAANGTKITEQTAGGSKSEGFYGVVATGDGHLIAVGYGRGSTNKQQGWLRKVDSKLLVGCK